MTTNFLEYHQPVFDLQEVADEAVGCTALDKVPLRGEKSLRVGRPKFLCEIGKQTCLSLLLDLVEGNGVAHGLH